MAAFHIFILLCAQILLINVAAAAPIVSEAAYPAIFVFGDSLSDAGNRAIASNSTTFATEQLPYGETFPGQPFGRYSDGHTLIDFLAAYMGLPLLNPNLNSSADFEAGVNYAVGGATALNVSFLNSFGISPETNLSLDIQLADHLAYKASVESSNGTLPGSPTLAAFVEGLYVIAIGGNDYANAFWANYTPSFVNSTLIPLVIDKIHSVSKTLLESGAKHLLLFSITPLGCSPSMLALFDGVKDNDGCLEEYNLASYLHGVHLQGEVASLRALHPNATFSFVDYYGAYKHVLKEKEMFGFVKTFEACCGAGDKYPYNYNPLQKCNINSISLCSDPNVYVSWDGIHFTDSFNFHIFNQTFLLGSHIDTNPFSAI